MQIFGQFIAYRGNVMDYSVYWPNKWKTAFFSSMKSLLSLPEHIPEQ